MKIFLAIFYFLQITSSKNADYEDLTLKVALCLAVVSLVFAIIYLFKYKEKSIREKDKKILELIKEHQDDLKEANQDYKRIIDNYHLFTQQLREIVLRGGKSEN